MTGRKWPWFVPLIILGVVIITNLPYLLAARAAGDRYVFGGFLLNPLDGNCYQAFMYEGWRGDWLFTLPFTPEISQGSYLYVFYLSLGHVARWLSVDLVVMYHTARLIGTVLLLLALYDFIKAVIPEERIRYAAFFTVAFGSGLGWLALAKGVFTPDFWVAEGYPFLSSYVNPHFTISLALLLWLVKPRDFEQIAPGFGIKLAFFVDAFFLGLLAPFGIILALLILGGEIAWQMKGSSIKRIIALFTHRLIWILLGGSLPILYELWVIYSDPVLVAWNSQNLTPSPPFWQLVWALSPALLLAVIGIYYVIRTDETRLRGLVFWLLGSLVLMYIPWSLQRRFILGLFIPVVILGVYGLSKLAPLKSRRFAYGMILLIALSLPTNLVVLLAARVGVVTHDPQIYLTRDEDNALSWIEKNTAKDALILSAPDTGLFIPAHTGRRVVYGHPYASLHAEAARSAVKDFYLSGGNLPDFLEQVDIDYVFWGPRERSLGSSLIRSNLRLVYQSGEVIIYAWD